MHFIKYVLILVVTLGLSPHIYANECDDMGRTQKQPYENDAKVARAALDEKINYYRAEKARGVPKSQIDEDGDGILEPKFYPIDDLISYYEESKTKIWLAYIKVWHEINKQVDICNKARRQGRAEVAGIAYSPFAGLVAFSLEELDASPEVKDAIKSLVNPIFVAHKAQREGERIFDDALKGGSDALEDFGDEAERLWKKF